MLHPSSNGHPKATRALVIGFEAAVSPEMSVRIYQTTRYRIPEESSLLINTSYTVIYATGGRRVTVHILI